MILPRSAHNVATLVALTIGLACSATSANSFRRNRVIYHFHLHKCGGTWFCHDAALNEETVAPKFRMNNCNFPGDHPAGTGGPGGLYNENFDCQDRLAHIGPATYFQTENVFNQHMLKCDDTMLLGIQLRHPMKRMASHINFNNKFRNDNIQKSREETFHNIQMKTVGFGSATVNNYIIRSLLGSKVYGLPLGHINHTHLELAKQVLDHFIVFILEAPTERDQLLECYYGWRRQTKTHFRDSRGASDLAWHNDIDAEWQARLFELNDLDIQLYEYGRQLSRQQLQACEGQ